MKKIIQKNRWVQGSFAVLFALVASFVIAQIHAATPTADIQPEAGTLTGSASIVANSSASGGSAISFGAAGNGSTCVVTNKLVNPCRPWLSAVVNNYPGFSSTQQVGLIAGHEKRIGRQLDVIHDYRQPGQNYLTADDKTLATRANTFLMLNWKPVSDWSQGYNPACTSTTRQTSSTPNNCDNGAPAATNAAIDSMAASISGSDGQGGIGNKQMFLTIFHEPENDVSANGSPSCGTSFAYKGTSGSTADYVKMWQYTVNRLTAVDGIKNVVFVWQLIGFSNWNCMVPDLYPGNSYVDWITYDPYFHNTQTATTAGAYLPTFYNWLTANSDSTHDYLSKPWGIGEWGDGEQNDQTSVENLYTSLATALDNNTYPRIKLWSEFDDTIGGDYRTDYNNTGTTANDTIDNTEQSAYNVFANDKNIEGSFSYTYNP